MKIYSSTTTIVVRGVELKGFAFTVDTLGRIRYAGITDASISDLPRKTQRELQDSAESEVRANISSIMPDLDLIVPVRDTVISYH